MAEFVLKSRKNETSTPDFALEKLENQDDKRSLEFFESKVEDIRPNKSLKPFTALTPITERIGTVPRLPWQLERLVSAACADVLPQGTAKLTAGLVPDLNRYVLGWGCAYLVKDRADAERRLWEVYRAWQGIN